MRVLRFTSRTSFADSNQSPKEPKQKELKEKVKSNGNVCGYMMMLLITH